MKTKKAFMWRFICLYYFVGALYSLLAYPFWHINELVMPFVFFGCTLFFLMCAGKYFSYKRYKWVAMLALAALLLGTRGNMNGYIVAVLKLLPFCSFVFMKDEYKLRLYQFLLKAFTVLFTVSLAGWIIHLLGVGTPYYIDAYGWSERRDDVQYLYENHWIFVVNLRLIDYIVNRFSGIFMEPGYVGCLMVVFLYLEGFDYKKYSSWLFTACLLMTYSVAGLLLYIVCLILRSLNSFRHKLGFILLFSFLLGGAYTFFRDYKQGENAINELLLERLSFDESEGTLTGYNRTQDEFDEWFNHDFFMSLDVFFGNPAAYDRRFHGEVNVGWKYYTAISGLVGLFAYLLYLWKVSAVRGRNYYKMVLFMLYVLIFMRGHFFNFSLIFMMLYFMGMLIYTNPEKQLQAN